MKNSFVEMKLFRVRPDKLEPFEALFTGHPRINLSAKAVYRSSIAKGSWNGKRSEKRDDFEGNGLQEIEQADRRQMEGVIKVEEMPHEAIDEGMFALLAVIEE